MTLCYAMQSLVGETAMSFVRNGNLLATIRHKVHKKFERSIQHIVRFVSFVIFVARKNRKVRERARSNSKS